MFSPNAMLYSQGFGSTPASVAFPHIDVRDPTSSDTVYGIGQRWINTVARVEFVLVSQSSVGGVLSSTWSEGGNAEASTSEFGIVQLATLSELQNGNAPAGAYVPTANDVATVIAGVVVGAVPPANTTQQGIVELATDLQVVSPYTTDVPNTAVQPSNIVAMFAAPPPIGATTPGASSFSDLTATGAVTFTGVTGALSMTSTTASTLNVTGAGIDLTLDSASGQLILTGGEAAANAVRIQADNAGGGIDIDAGTLGIAMDTTGAFSIDGAAASNVTVTGAGIDLLLNSVLGSVLVSSTEDAALAIRLHANGGTSETIQVHSDQGTGVGSINLLSDVGGLTLRATGLASNDAINLEAAAGGVDIDAAMQINITTTQSAADSIVILSTAGGIDILASGAVAGEDIDIVATGSSVNVTSTENAAEAIYIRANGGVSETIRLHADQGTGVASINIGSDVGGVTIAGGLGTADAVNITASTAGGGIDIDASTAGVIVDTTGAISLDSAAASNFTVTGAFDLTLSSTLGSVVVTSAEAAVDAVRVNASNAAGGIDIDAGTGGITVDTTGAFSIDGAAASNVTTTGAGIDLTLASVLGSVLVSSTENAALAIRLHANGGTSETIQLHADQGTGVASIGLLSDVGGLTLRSTGLASADAINLEAAAGGIDMDGALEINITSSQAAATAINIVASAGTGGITMAAGSGGVNVTGATVVTGALTTSGDLTLSSVATKISMNGGAATDFIGTATLIGGQATVLNTNIAAGDRIMISRSALNASPALGFLVYTITPATSFLVESLSAVGAAVATDVSSFTYVIVRQT